MQPFLNDLRGVIDRLLQRTLPDDSHTPSNVSKNRCMARVPVDISLEFLFPEFAVRHWRGGVPTAFVPVPETAVNEYHGPVFREHQIRRARQISYMKPVPESPSEQKRAKHPFRPRVFPANARHHAAALRSGRKAHGLSAFCLGVCGGNGKLTTRNSSLENASAGCGGRKSAMSPIHEKSRGGD